jgi:integrase
MLLAKARASMHALASAVDHCTARTPQLAPGPGALVNTAGACRSTEAPNQSTEMSLPLWRAPQWLRFLQRFILIKAHARKRVWRTEATKALPRLRTREGEAQKHRQMSGDDALRARKASANRTWTVLRAALNRAFDEGEVDSDLAWRKVKPFKGVDKARVRYLEVVDAQRLANTTDAEFRPMVQGALLTGGRYGQLAGLVVADFNGDAGTVRMTTRKGDGTEKVYHVHLTVEGTRFFKQICIGRNDASSLIFR